MSEKLKVILKELATKIKKEFQDAEVILFGSVARGDDTEESDVDILVLLDKREKGTFDKIIDICFQIEQEYDVVISPLVHTREEWNSFPCNVSEIKYSIEKEGIKL